jgi:hypothetical protein
VIPPNDPSITVHGTIHGVDDQSSQRARAYERRGIIGLLNRPMRVHRPRRQSICCRGLPTVRGLGRRRGRWIHASEGEATGGGPLGTKGVVCSHLSRPIPLALLKPECMHADAGRCSRRAHSGCAVLRGGDRSVRPVLRSSHLQPGRGCNSATARLRKHSCMLLFLSLV